jgi:transcriptional regulator with XRE-family HTH domain
MHSNQLQVSLPDSASVEEQIGGRVRQLRQVRGMTLDALASATGFTKSYLSKIENAKKIPPIASLSRIAQAMKADISYFFQPADQSEVTEERVSLVRATERQQAIRGGSAFGYDYVSLAKKVRNKRMEPFIFTFPPDLSNDVLFEHEGEEVVFVLSGRVGFEVGNDKWILEPGDTLLFDTALPHRGRSIRGEAKALVVIFKP